MWETPIQFLGREDPLEKGRATHPSILAWRIPWGHKESDVTDQLLLFWWVCILLNVSVVLSGRKTPLMWK